jgi:hypothetical protein
MEAVYFPIMVNMVRNALQWNTFIWRKWKAKKPLSAYDISVKLYFPFWNFNTYENKRYYHGFFFSHFGCFTNKLRMKWTLRHLCCHCFYPKLLGFFCRVSVRKNSVCFFFPQKVPKTTNELSFTLTRRHIMANLNLVQIFKSGCKIFWKFLLL